MENILTARSLLPLILVTLALPATNAHGDTGKVCNRSHVIDCVAALAWQKQRIHHLEQGIAWQKKARLDAVRARDKHGYGVDHAIRLAAAVFGVSEVEMRRIGECESHLDPLARNQHSNASGLFQMLSSTWARVGIRGFSVFDPYANAFAAARLRVLDGSWREWACRA